MSKVTVNYTNIAKLNRSIQRAIVATADAIKTDIIDKQVMPFKDGTLQGSLDSDSKSFGKAYVRASTPYARRLYYHPEYNFHREPWTTTVRGKEKTVGGNKNAGGKYFEPWTKQGKYKNWVLKRFSEFVKMFGDV